MKAFLAFLFLISLASATYTPTWTTCGNHTQDLNVTSIIFKKDPNNATNTYVAACGDVTSQHGPVTAFHQLIVNGTYANWVYYEIKRAFVTVVPSGGRICLDVSSDFIEYAQKDVTLRMAAYTLAGYQAACVDIVVKYSDSKFLGDREYQLEY